MSVINDDAAIESTEGAQVDVPPASSDSSVSPEAAPQSEPTAQPAAPSIPQVAAQAGITVDQLKQILSEFSQQQREAMQQIIPKPPPAPKAYDDEKWLSSDFKTFRGGLDQLVSDKLAEFEEQKLGNLRNIVDQLQQILPNMYAYAAPNPQFGAVQQRANEIIKAYGVPSSTALRMAKDEIDKRPATSVRSAMKPKVPGFASAPDTRQGTEPIDNPNGPKDFASIIKELRASGQME